MTCPWTLFQKEWQVGRNAAWGDDKSDTFKPPNIKTFLKLQSFSSLDKCTQMDALYQPAVLNAGRDAEVLSLFRRTLQQGKHLFL
jgi:hypothetical protein